MEAKELMIGDWVHVNPISKRVTAHNSQICALTRNPNDTISIEGFYNGHFGWSVGEEYVEPIPITEEILKANGFEFVSKTDVWTKLYKLKSISISIHNMGKLYILHSVDYSMPSHYVHQLQHALRLVGMVELADNFKIR